MTAKSRGPKIITFIGPVGVGKSTQIRLLKRHLESQGQKTITTYIKSAHGLTYLLSRFLRLLTDADHPGDEQFMRLMQRRVAPLWNATETVSVTLKFLASVYLPYMIGYNVIMEEGLPMSIEHHLTFRPRLLGVKPQRLPLLELLLRWVNSTNHVEVVLDAGDEEVAKRRLTRSYRRHETVDYLTLQRQAIKRLRGPRLIVLDTSDQSIEVVHRRIIQLIEGL